jgi:hypothetical protein
LKCSATFHTLAGTVFCANPKQRELSWYMLFFQHPEAEELLAADNWALMRQLWGKNSNEQEMQDYIDALSQPGACSRSDLVTQQMCC